MSTDDILSKTKHNEIFDLLGIDFIKFKSLSIPFS